MASRSYCFSLEEKAIMKASLEEHSLTPPSLIECSGLPFLVMWWFLLLCILSCFSRVWLFCDPMDCSPPGSSILEILQARILEWVAISSFRRSSRPKDWTHVSYITCIGRQVLCHWCHLGSPFSFVVVSEGEGPLSTPAYSSLCCFLENGPHSQHSHRSVLRACPFVCCDVQRDGGYKMFLSTPSLSFFNLRCPPASHIGSWHSPFLSRLVLLIYVLFSFSGPSPLS